MNKRTKHRMAAAGLRVIISASAGIIAGLLSGHFVSWPIAPLVGWDTAAIIFLLWIYISVRGSDAERTAALANQEDTSRPVTEVITILASVASLAAVIVLLLQSDTGSHTQVLWHIALGILSVVISWTLLHTIYMIRYAHMYYRRDSGVNFNDKAQPRYSDFAYLAFTIGMTFQVSDTEFTNNHMRRRALMHALLSYLFGTVIVASTINLIAGLIK